MSVFNRLKQEVVSAANQKLQSLRSKRESFTLVLLLLIAAIFCTGCMLKTPKEEPVEEDGGVKDNSDYDAPKVIQSDLIIAFQCDFSALDRTEEDTYLSGKNYRLEARLKDGAVKGRYDLYGDRDEDILFAADHSFMYRLQEVVSKHNLVQYNGMDIFVSGLPEMYGSKLQIVYASGERIYATNNQDCFLPLEAMEELETIFRQNLPGMPVSENVDAE